MSHCCMIQDFMQDFAREQRVPIFSFNHPSSLRTALRFCGATCTVPLLFSHINQAPRQLWAGFVLKGVSLPRSDQTGLSIKVLSRQSCRLGLYSRFVLIHPWVLASLSLAFFGWPDHEAVEIAHPQHERSSVASILLLLHSSQKECAPRCLEFRLGN